MNYFIRKYINIIMQLENYKKILIALRFEKDINSVFYEKCIKEIDELLLQKYIKVENLLNDLTKNKVN